MVLVHIIVTPQWSFIKTEGKQKTAAAALRRAMSWRPRGGDYAEAAMLKKNPNTSYTATKYLYESGRFPTGLLNVARQVLTAYGIKYDIIDERKPLPEMENGWEYPKEYQSEAINACLKRFKARVKLPTGSGKSVVVVGIVRELLKHPTFQRIAVIAPRLKIVSQFKEHFDRSNINVGIVASGGADVSHEVTIYGVQALDTALRNKNKNLVQKNTVDNFIKSNAILFDEVHLIGGNNYYEIIMAASPTVCYGFSATTDMRSDEANIYQRAAFGDVVYDRTEEDIQEEGMIVPVRATFLVASQVYARQYRQAVESGIIFHDERNKMAVEWAETMVERGKSTLILVNELTHGHIINSISGIPFIHGQPENNDVKRRFTKLYDMFKAGDQMVLIVTQQLIGIGVDIPRVEALVNLGGGRGEQDIVQRIGRGMRASDGKTMLEVLDFCDMHRTLYKHSIDRLSHYVKHGYEIDLKQCAPLLNHLEASS